MKLTIKSIKQIAYEVEVANDSSVKDLKKEIESKHGFDHSTLKLLFKGQLLDDLKTLKDYSINENEVLVMMNMKAKPVNVPKEEEKKQDKVPENKITSTTTNTNTSTQQQPNKPLVSTAKPEKDYTAQIKQLSEMGFSGEEAKHAIKAARGNVEIAIEFLYNGIPDDLPEQELQGEESLNSPDKLLKSIASVIKVACQGNPGNLTSMMAGLEQTQPELVNLIRQNEEQFRTLISQPINEEDIRTFQTFTQQGRQSQQGQNVSGGRTGVGSSQQGGSSQHGASQQEGGRGQIKLTKEEFDVINRLKQFGFSEIDCVQAYFAFDKNEELALNFLFDNKQQEDFSLLNILQNQIQSNINQQPAKNDNVTDTSKSTNPNVNQGTIEQNIKKEEENNPESKKDEDNK